PGRHYRRNLGIACDATAPVILRFSGHHASPSGADVAEVTDALRDGKGVQTHQVRNCAAIVCTSSTAPDATAIIKSKRSSSLAVTHSPFRPRNTWQAVHAKRMLPSRRAWLRHKECNKAAALVWMSG